MPRYGVTWPEADAAASRVATEIEAQKLPLPPQALIDAIGGGDGSAVGRNNLRLLLSLGNLTTASRVLEPGCGFGRNARWLGPYLRTGTYDGFDIVPNLVEWGEKELTRRYPNVRFQLAQVLNKHYTGWLNVKYSRGSGRGRRQGVASAARPFAGGVRPTVGGRDLDCEAQAARGECRGRNAFLMRQYCRSVCDDLAAAAKPAPAPLDAATYRFPYSDSSFDVVFSPSVFTHLLRRPLENYLAESCRVMRPGATALLWFFVLDERARSALTTQPMAFPRGLRAEYHDEVSFALKAAPEAMIAFNLSYIKGALVNAGFERRSIRVLWGSWRAPPGSGNAVPPPPAWTGTPVPHTEAQDVILARKPAARRPG